LCRRQYSLVKDLCCIGVVGTVNGESIKQLRLKWNQDSLSKKLPYSRHSEELLPLAPVSVA